MDKQYNILWITLDSLKATALPNYGNEYCIAPNAQRVAKKGVTFSHAFAQMPKCIPSRPSMITGCYPHIHGLRAIKGKADQHSPGSVFTVTEDMPNIIKELKDHGYQICHQGVQHLLEWGAFEKWVDVKPDYEDLKTALPIPNTIDDATLLRAKYAGPVPDDYDMEEHSDCKSTRHMCDFLRSDHQKPFFAYLDIRAPHPMYRKYPYAAEHYAQCDIPLPSKADIDNVPWTEKVYRECYELEDLDDQCRKDIVAAYYSAITYNDMLVGRVLDTIEEQGLDKNTIIIYSADHGDFAGEHGCIEKHDVFLYDCMTRLPLIMQLPEDFPQDIWKESLVEMIDIAPTLLDLCGMDVPRWIQGKSLKPLIMGEVDHHRDVVFSQGGVERSSIDLNKNIPREELSGGENYYKQQVILDHPEFLMRSKMIRSKNHKYIYRLNGHHELYDLDKDPDELHNVIADSSYDEVLNELRERLIHWMIEAETAQPLMDRVTA
ncbi:MAG: sulfatase-like hydrolase/transferase [Planctomycetes bacterium]|nr:sulfatase-like hydrolase/transferase [Planctomycetota bacterium]